MTLAPYKIQRTVLLISGDRTIALLKPAVILMLEHGLYKPAVLSAATSVDLSSRLLIYIGKLFAQISHNKSTLKASRIHPILTELYKS